MTGRVGAGYGAEVVALSGPPLWREQQGGWVGVAAGAGHPQVAGAQPGLHPVQDAQFPVVPVRGAAALAPGRVEVATPAGRHEHRRVGCRRLVRDVVRPAALSPRNTSTASSSAATCGLAVLPVSGSAAITTGVKVRRYL